MRGNVSRWGWRKGEELRRCILFPVQWKCGGDCQVSKRVSSLSAECGVNVSSFIHMAGSERRKKALLLISLEVYVEQGLLGWFWQLHVDGALFARGSGGRFLWRSSREDKFTIVSVWADYIGSSPMSCAPPRSPDQQTNKTFNNVFSLKYTPWYNSSGHWECVLKVDEDKHNIVLVIGCVQWNMCVPW